MCDVLYIPSMNNNLLSLGQLLGKCYTMIMKQNHIEVYNSKQRLLLNAPLSKNKNFKIKLDATAIQRMSAVNVEEES